MIKEHIASPPEAANYAPHLAQWSGPHHWSEQRDRGC